MDKIIRVKEKTYEKLYNMVAKKRNKQFQNGNYSSVSFDDILEEMIGNQ